MMHVFSVKMKMSVDEKQFPDIISGFHGVRKTAAGGDQDKTAEEQEAANPQTDPVNGKNAGRCHLFNSHLLLQVKRLNSTLWYVYTFLPFFSF